MNAFNRRVIILAEHANADAVQCDRFRGGAAPNVSAAVVPAADARSVRFPFAVMTNLDLPGRVGLRLIAVGTGQLDQVGQDRLGPFSHPPGRTFFGHDTQVLLVAHAVFVVLAWFHEVGALRVINHVVRHAAQPFFKGLQVAGDPGSYQQILDAGRQPHWSVRRKTWRADRRNHDKTSRPYLQEVPHRSLAFPCWIMWNCFRAKRPAPPVSGVFA